MANLRSQPLPRRSFLTHAATAGAATAIGFGAPAAAQAQNGARFRPARHAQDDWLDSLPGRHRLYLDSISAAGAGDALGFATNFLNASKSGYGLADGDAAIVVCMRHFATPYMWTDAIWRKYGAAFTDLTKLNDPKTGKAPTINLYNTAEIETLNNSGATVDSLVTRGVHFAVCDMATHFIAGVLAQQTKESAEAIYKEITSGTLPNAHYVAAGIVATNRAQERGYTLAHCG